MKHVFKLVCVVAVLIIASSKVYGSNRTVNGLIIGSGTGALVGQAFGRNMESTLIGAAVGGIIGVAVTSDHKHKGYKKRRYHDNWSHYPSQHYHQPYYYSPSRKHAHKHYKKHGRHKLIHKRHKHRHYPRHFYQPFRCR